LGYGRLRPDEIDLGSFGNPIDAYFQKDELLYVNEIIFEIKKQEQIKLFEIEKQKKIQLIDNTSNISNIIQNQNIDNASGISNVIQNQNDDSGDDGESASSSIPNPRSIFEFINHDDFNKSKYIRIQNWLNNSSSSSDLIPKDDLQNLFH
jgi:hypothetical protein